MMSGKLDVVLAGCGAICDAWFGQESVQKKVRVVGCVDLIEGAAAKRADEFGVPGAVVGTDLTSVLKATNPDAVFDCTTPPAHASVALTALRHGCHVLGEKPMADTIANARRMLRAAESAGKIGAVIQNRRFDKNIRSLCRFLNSGKIGKVTTIQSNFFIGAHFGGFRDHMKHVLLSDMAIHTFDAARLITGAKPLSVYCKEWNPAGSWYDHDASAVAIFEMSNGIVYTYQGSWCAEGCNTNWECQWHIIGEKGSVSWNGSDEFRAQAVVGKNGFFRKTKDLSIPISCPRKLQGEHSGVIMDFIAAVQNGGTPETAYKDNINSLAMVDGAIRSAEQERKIKLKL